MNLDKLKKYKYPTIYIILFIIFAMILKSTFLFIMASIVFSLLLLLIKKDAAMTTVAIAYANGGKIEESTKILTKLISKNTKYAPCYAFYGNTLLLDNKPLESIPILEKGLTLKPDSTTYKTLNLVLSSCYWVTGDIKKAINLLEDLQKKYDYLNSNVLATLGYLYLLDDNTDLARKTSLLALEDNESSSSALDNLGQIEFKCSNPTLAKEYFNKALDIKENLVDSLYYMGLISIDEENYDQANFYLNKAKLCNFSVMNTVTLEMVNEKLAEICNK